jgi:hypothetical protein
MTVGELCRQVVGKYDGKNLRAEALTETWNSLSINPTVWNENMRRVPQPALWLVLLSLLPLCGRSIVLIEEPIVKNEAVDSFITQLARQGREVICTTQTQPLNSFQVKNITSKSE